MTGRGAPEFILPDWPVPRSVRAFVVTRFGGTSQRPFDGFNLATHVGDEAQSVLANRQILTQALPGQPGLQWLQQVHGTEVHELESVGPEQPGDGLWTRRPGLACCILTADCLPVFVANRAGDEVGLAHAGWRGLSGGILAALTASMSGPPESLVAWLGPAIGPCHFEVGSDVLCAFAAESPASAHSRFFMPVPGSDRFHADLYGLARQQLQELGVQWVGGGGFCTVCDEARFYSYRRDGRTGRNLSVIYLI